MDLLTFTLKDGARTVASPCLDIVAYSNAAPGAAGKGFDHCLRTFAGRFGTSLAFYQTGDMKSLRPVDERTLDGPYHWFSDEKILSTKQLAFVAHSGPKKSSSETPGLGLTLWGFDQPPRFFLRMALSAAVAGDPDDVVSFAREALAELPFENGYCGYSFFGNSTTDDDTMAPWAAPLLSRHPGLNYQNPWPLAKAARTGVAVVSWLTFLGPQLAGKLGGLTALKDAVPERVSVLEIGRGGVLLRAGEAPQIGDVNRHELLPLYHAVGRLVSPVRASDEALDSVNIKGISTDVRHDWLRRFFI